MKTQTVVQFGITGLLLMAIACGCPKTRSNKDASTESSGLRETQTAKACTDRTEEAVVRGVRDAMQQAATLHNARLGWYKAVKPRGEFGDVYTIDVQDALTADSSKPVVLVASLLDVAKRDGELVGTFCTGHIGEQSDDSKFEFVVVITLTCSADLAPRLLGEAALSSVDLVRRENRLKQLMGGTPSFGKSEFIVVAEFSDVMRPTLAVIGSATGGSGYNAEVTLEFDSGATFLARGRCIDLIPISSLPCGAVCGHPEHE